ncbi:MAG: InlB B-repeat-containing protein, partial [Clostridiales bacterium]|nr:InlB B-repeat-containing protein [Clostridiales bacterium]
TMPAKPFTLYAKWNVISYEITWQNYDLSELETTSADYGTFPEYTGKAPYRAPDDTYQYEFAGWTPEPVRTDKNATYTATFTKEQRRYAVTFDNNGKGNAVASQSVLPGGVIPKPDAPEDEKFVLLGWFTDPACTDANEWDFENDKMPAKAFTLYAKWQQKPECRHAHTENVAGRNATCKDVGYTSGVYCHDCEKFISGHVEIPKSDVHTYGGFTISADTHSRTCAICGHVETEDHVFDIADASEEYLVSPATETQKATYYYSCECGAHGGQTFEYGAPLGHVHTLTKVYAKKATCTKSGNIEYYICTGCSATFADAGGIHQISLRKIRISATG